MDSIACYSRCSKAFSDGDYEEAREALRDLISWTEKGGHIPQALVVWILRDLLANVPE